MYLLDNIWVSRTLPDLYEYTYHKNREASDSQCFIPAHVPWAAHPHCFTQYDDEPSVSRLRGRSGMKAQAAATLTPAQKAHGDRRDSEIHFYKMRLVLEKKEIQFPCEWCIHPQLLSPFLRLFRSEGIAV